jgi:phosphohistidine phosphatase
LKTLYLLRHAEADNNPLDPERELTARGRRQAESLGRWMAGMGILPACIFSSPAKRAQATARICSENAGYQGRILFEDDLYDTNGAAYFAVLAGLGNKYDSVMIVGHNPAISDVLAILTGNRHHMLPCALACIEFASDEWASVQNSDASLTWVQNPAHGLGT